MSGYHRESGVGSSGRSQFVDGGVSPSKREKSQRVDVDSEPARLATLIFVVGGNGLELPLRVVGAFNFAVWSN